MKLKEFRKQFSKFKEQEGLYIIDNSIDEIYGISHFSITGDTILLYPNSHDGYYPEVLEFIKEWQDLSDDLVLVFKEDHQTSEIKNQVVIFNKDQDDRIDSLIDYALLQVKN